MAAITAAYRAGSRAFNDPGAINQQESASLRALQYSHAWAYYRNYAFDDASAWATYTTAYSLYRYTRLTYNPIPTIVDFYVDHIYPGIADEQAVDDKGRPVLTPVTPVLDGTDETLKEAIAQHDQWSNWQAEQGRAVRFGAVTGNVLLEVLDEVEREKVTTAIWWPSHVKNIELDGTGNVKAYCLEYQVYEDDGLKFNRENYTYRKEVTEEFIKTFRDDIPYDFSGEAQLGVEYDNPYGFVPAVWIRHIDDGLDYGSPAVWNIGKVDELNSLASHTHDQIHKAINAHKVLATDGNIIPISGGTGSSQSNDMRVTADVRQDVLLLKAPSGTTVETLVGTLDLAEADPYIERLLKSFERDYPELQAVEVIQNKAQLSGAALERMLAPSQAKLDRAAANYNQQIIKLKQMAVAIGGWRQRSTWTQRSPQQERFAPFDLKSYEQGDLDFALKRSLLVQETEDERVALEGKRIENAVKASGFFSQDKTLEVAGITDPEERAQMLKQIREQDVIPTVTQ